MHRLRRHRVPLLPSGEQFEIAHGSQRAVIVEVGGGVRAYNDDGRPVLHPYDADQICDGAHGAPLIPWPNRLADGRYSFDGTEHQLPISEPAKSNAIHGLLRWRPWRALVREPDRVAMAATLFPRDGYPFHLEVQVDYRLDEQGLTVTTSVLNPGGIACPVGIGQHPYLSAGEGVIDDCLLEFGAQERLLTDDRQLPTGTEDVPGTAYDFSAARKLGGLAIDYAFRGLRRDEHGKARLRLTGTDGRTAEFWADGSYPYLEIFTADGLEASRRRRGLGVEPMSCPPNAFRTGESLLRLEPGGRSVHRWGVRLS